MPVMAYTDGTSTNNYRPARRCGGWAAILLLVDEMGKLERHRVETYREISGHQPEATHNQMALEAVRQALLALDMMGVEITIMSDSAYVIGVLTSALKVTANRTLVTEIRGLIANHQVTFAKVPAHIGDQYKARVDQLAQEEAWACDKNKGHMGHAG
jgi:ribonuclease HI